jgi:hypothetical protein
MTKRFIFELIAGILLLIAVILFGAKGMVALIILAVQPFIGKKKADEREFQLFYKVGNYTAGAVLVACIIIYECSDMVVNGQLIGKLWLFLVISAFLIAHGASGLIIFKKN